LVFDFGFFRCFDFLILYGDRRAVTAAPARSSGFEGGVVSRAIVGSLTAFVLLGAAYAGCTNDFDQFEPSGGSITAGTGGQGGQGGGGICAADPDCDDMNPCTDDACAMGECSNTPIADGSVPGAGGDDPADCVDRMCVAGVDQGVPDDTEVPDDANACTTDVCSGGSPVHMNEPVNTACGDLFCDGMGQCVGCTKANHCPETGNDCKARTCVDKVCGTMNIAMGMGCQGGVCNGMGMCLECLNNTDCEGGSVCMGGMCIDMCEDGAMNGDETDVDCGGGECPKCKDGDLCDGDGDCESDDCSGGVCVSCSDGLLNGTETDVDCGGDCPANCADSKICSDNDDCSSNNCSGGICISCMDGVLNGTETDVDCGGTCQANCANGKVCKNNGDCQSNKCSSGICAP
jgi:hypothetical protein